MKTQLQAEMKRVRDLLPTELFASNKNWREGNTVERIEWLLSMYASAKAAADAKAAAIVACAAYADALDAYTAAQAADMESDRIYHKIKEHFGVK